MSDIYLVLRRRLAEVKSWVTLGQDVMQKARDAHGWSYETVARKIPVSSKTYERYEKRGQVPIEMVDRVAEVLGLTIERPAFRAVVTLEAPEQREAMLRQLAEIERLVVEVREGLLVGAPPGPQAETT